MQANGSENGFTKFLFSIDKPHNITNTSNLRVLRFLVVTTFSSWALLCCWVNDRGYFTIIIKNYFLAWLICPSTWEAHFCTHLASPCFSKLEKCSVSELSPSKMFSAWKLSLNSVVMQQVIDEHRNKKILLFGEPMRMLYSLNCPISKHKEYSW